MNSRLTKIVTCFSCFVVFAFMLSCQLNAQSATELANITDFEDMEYQFDFETTEAVASIDSIVIEFSHANVVQVQMFLENTGSGSPYAFFTLVNGFGNTDQGNRIGVLDGNFGDLNGLAELTFVESGPSETVQSTFMDPVPTGSYLAEDWENHFGSGVPPYEPTTWRLVIRDSSFLFDHVGAIGRVTVNYTTAGGGQTETPGSFTLIRGVEQSGTFANLDVSDDIDFTFRPGFTINSNEAPLRLQFDWALQGNPAALALGFEASASTPNLRQTIEVFNWNTMALDMVDVRDATFNVDSIVAVDLTANISDYVSSSNEVAVQTAWKADGFVINFPWEVDIDHVFVSYN